MQFKSRYMPFNVQARFKLGIYVTPVRRRGPPQGFSDHVGKSVRLLYGLLMLQCNNLQNKWEMRWVGGKEGKV